MSLLDGLRVIDFCDERGLLAGRLLADLGADVIAVEPPEGNRARRLAPWLAAEPDGKRPSAIWEAYGANRRGVALDLRDADDRDEALGLCTQSDFVLESSGPGIMDALGLGYPAIAHIAPQIIYVSISAFGGDGPKARYAETDLIVWAAAGPLHSHRDGDRPPVRISSFQAYLFAAADAAAGALIAHHARRRTGRGQHVDASAQQSAAQNTLSRILAGAVGDPVGMEIMPPPPKHPRRRRLDQSGSGSATGRSKWDVADGALEMHLAIGPSSGQFTNNLITWMREEDAIELDLAAVDWRHVPALVEAGELDYDDFDARVRDAVGRFLATKTKRELTEAAIQYRILAAPVSTVADIAGSPHHRHRDFFVRDTCIASRARLLPGAFARVAGDGFALGRPAPGVGEHDGELLFGRGAILAGGAAQASMNVGDDGRPALDGLRVLDLSWVVAGPAIGRALADFGADVIRVESGLRPDTARLVGPHHGGRPNLESSACYGNVNAGKRGITLNLREESARSVVVELVAWADIVVDSFSPGVMERWGLGADRLRKLNPQAIFLSSSIMGHDGPFAGLAGYGNVGGALAGFQHLAGWPDRPPFGPYGPYTDYIAPRLGLVVLLASLEHRARTGEGIRIDLSQVEAGIFFLAPELAAYASTGETALRRGNRDLQMAPHGVFACRRGAEHESTWVTVAVRDDDDWRRLAAVIGGAAIDLRFERAAGRLEHVEQIEQLVADWTAGHTARDVETTLQRHGVPAHATVGSDQAPIDPQLVHRGHFVTLPHPVHGATTVEGPRVRLSATPGAVRRAAPTLGQDNDDVLRNVLGYDDGAITRLEQAGALQ
jgi:crotonobetainyl-CoA:carnitine CoA-transferase CaiB-like acyl-CoA transferase